MSLKLHIKILLNCVLLFTASILLLRSMVRFHLMQSKRPYVHLLTLCIPHAKKFVIAR